MRTVQLESPLVQNPGATLELNDRTVLSHRDSRHPQEDQSILTERDAELRMADNLEQESTIVPGIPRGSNRQLANRESAKDERPGSKCQLLIPVFASTANELDCLCFRDCGARDTWLRKLSFKKFERIVSDGLQHGRLRRFRVKVGIADTTSHGSTSKPTETYHRPYGR
jgi:hypothetical protein